MAELTTNINYLQPTGFKVVINRKKFGNLEYFAQSISHPTVSVDAAPVSYKRVNLHMAGDKLTFGQLTANIILNEDMSAYTEMYEWMERLVEQNNLTRYDVRTGDEDTTSIDISVVVLSSTNNLTKTIRYVDCVPIEMGSIDFQATTSDIQYLTFPVTFSFSYFQVI